MIDITYSSVDPQFACSGSSLIKSVRDLRNRLIVSLNEDFQEYLVSHWVEVRMRNNVLMKGEKPDSISFILRSCRNKVLAIKSAPFDIIRLNKPNCAKVFCSTNRLQIAMSAPLLTAEINFGIISGCLLYTSDAAD